MSEIKEYYALLDLVRLGIDLKKYYVKKDYTDIDWTEVFELSKLHRVSAIAFQGLVQLIKVDTILLNDNLLKEWLSNFEQQKVIDMSQRITFEEIKYIFEKERITYYPFKGFALKNLYPKSYFREMTDIDFFVNMKNFEKAEMMLLDYNYIKSKESNSSVLTMLKGPLVKIEIQNVFFDNERHPIIASYFETVLPKKLDKKELQLYWDETIVYVYLFCHLYKHLKGSGIGIRLILDLWLYETKNKSKIEWEKVSQIFLNLEIAEDYLAIRDIMNEWFEMNSYSQNEKLENYILLSGIFGTIDHLIDNNIKKEKNKVVYIFKRLFPPKAFVKLKYPNMKRNSIFLPYYWCKRAIGILIFNNKKVLYEAKILIKRKEK